MKSVMPDMEIPVTIIQKAPNKIKQTIEVFGQEIVEAYDGETAWTINPLENIDKPTKLSAERAKVFAQDAILEGNFINYQAKGHIIEFEGKEKLEGKEHFKVKLTLNNGDIEYRFFDTETYLPFLKQSTIKSGEHKGKTLDTHYGDYKKVGNLLLPHAIVKSIEGTIYQNITVNKIEINLEIEDSAFAFKE